MRILIAYDGSEWARAALSDLRIAALPADATALVLSAVDCWLPDHHQPGGQATDGPADVRLAQANARRVVEKQRSVAEDGATRLRELFPKWKVEAHACADAPAWAIIDRAEGGLGGVDGKPADLVVVGSRGYGGLLGGIRRLVLGSVSHHVVTAVRCSVRVARPRVLPALAPTTSPPKILIGVDGSADARAAVDALAARKWPIGTQVLVAAYAQGMAGIEHSNVMVAGSHAVWGGEALSGAGPAPADAWGVFLVDEAAQMIRERCTGVAVSTVLKLGDPKYGLVEEAAAWGDGGADCIFVGAKGVRGIERFILGSVSTAVAMNAHCSVEIVHPRRE